MISSPFPLGPPRTPGPDPVYSRVHLKTTMTFPNHLHQVQSFKLTANVQCHRVADTVALDIVGNASVDPGLASLHVLEDQTLVADDHPGMGVGQEGCLVESPRDLVRLRVGPDRALEVNVVALLDVGTVE